uniref:CCHC-type domain-containing protein n=1 Tax=Tanacetum cinerariifolium TaxID=118510 RepID=A0A699GLA1_TANCI|nr:hypothetical protein [Tanacetum cinerariifolium]
MSWVSRCSWCGGLFNEGNCRHCTNVSFEDKPVYDSNSNSYDQTPDFSCLPSQPQTSSLNQRHCFYCKDTLEEDENCQRCTCKRCGSGLSKGFCHICASRDENSSIDNLNSFNDTSNIFTHPPQLQYKTYLCGLCGNDSHYGYDCPPRFMFVYEQEPCYNQNFSDNYYPHNSSSFLCFDNCEVFHHHQPPIIQEDLNLKLNIDEFMVEQRNELFKDMKSMFEEYRQREQATNLKPPSIVITTSPPVLPIKDPKDSLIMKNEELNTILEKESDEFIKSSIGDLVPIPSESEYTSGSESVCILPSCVREHESKGSYDSNLDEPDLLVTPLSDVNKDECFDSEGDVDEINDFEDGYYDSKGDILYLESLLSDDTTPNLPPEVFLDQDLRSLSDAPIDDLMSEDKNFYRGICVNFFQHM